MGHPATRQSEPLNQGEDNIESKTRKRAVTGREIVITPNKKVEDRYNQFLFAQESRKPEDRAKAMDDLKVNDPELSRFIEDQMESEMDSIKDSFRSIREADDAFYSVLNEQNKRTAKFMEGLTMVSEEVSRNLNAIDTTGEVVANDPVEKPVLYLPDEQSGIRGTNVALKEEVSNETEESISPVVDKSPVSGNLGRIKEAYKKLVKKISSFLKPFFNRNNNKSETTVIDDIEPPLAFSKDEESDIRSTKVSSETGDKKGKKVA